MRAPFQILAIPFRHITTGLEFAVLKRSDGNYWQFVAGGGEDEESPVQAAERETKEEIGIAADGRLLGLDSMATVPKHCFAAADCWEEIYVIPQYCFAIDAGDSELAISSEHTEVRWLSYDQAWSLLTWDSNRCALWELNERLKTMAFEAAGGGDALRGV